MNMKFGTFKNFVFSILLRALLTPLRLLPVKQNRVLFVSFRGKQYSCNPKYISKALQKYKDAEIIWAFHKPEKFKYLEKSGIKVIGDRGLEFIITALTARVVVTNTYYKPFIPRRKKQFYLRTWHGGGAYKKVTYPKGLMGLNIRMQQQGADLYLSSSKEFTRSTLREAFGYKGEVLEVGMPRNDMLVSGEWKRIGLEVKKELGLEGKKILLYAPTFRDKGGDGDKIEFEKVKAALSRRFGGEWVALYRGHHVVTDTKTACFGDMDVSLYPDMQPLLCAADVLITDYSSSMWDMSLTGKKVLLYCTDLAEFSSSRDFFTDIHTWPFPLAENGEALLENISRFDEAAYASAIQRHHDALGNAETGRAAQITAEKIAEILRIK